MRAIKTTTISILALGLLAGSAVGAAAQDEAPVAGAPTGASFFTGTYEGGFPTTEPVVTAVDDGEQIRGLVVQGTIDTSDPRMTGVVTQAIDIDDAELGDAGRVSLSAHSWRIENDGGSWVGPGTGLGYVDADFEFLLDTATVSLTGEDGYAGLVAYLIMEGGLEPVVTGAVLVGAMPPFPELPAAE